jgi:hypothetical protein
MTKSFSFLKGYPAAGQGLEVDEEEERYKQGGQGYGKPANLPKKQQLWQKAFFEGDHSVGQGDLK